MVIKKKFWIHFCKYIKEILISFFSMDGFSYDIHLLNALRNSHSICWLCQMMCGNASLKLTNKTINLCSLYTMCDIAAIEREKLIKNDKICLEKCKWNGYKMENTLNH